ncbi:F-box protein CPR1-like isoform X2 [Silene latifolia]|uniref:F-box protein CPR1-like isoform X2 n=1 Tax=Silene latifolia TaxID=37657 RepID=UPI003D76ED69
MAIPILPLEIITDILSRLQSKTLIRFKSVSKQWYSLINSPDFINLHLSQTLISQNPPNLIISRLSLFSSQISENQSHDFHFSELDHPLKPFYEINRKFLPQIIGSINGVVCFSSWDRSSVFLYNPSTKTHRLIPAFSNRNPELEKTYGNNTAELVVFGFGFESVSRDYKVVRMAKTRNNQLASVYSLRDDSWKCVNDETIMEFYLYSVETVLVDENLHFIVFDDSIFKPKIKCFNLRTEIFSIFDLPEFDKRFSGTQYVIKELGGCFSVLLNYHNPILEMEASWGLVRVDLWVMKEHGNEESWFRLFSIRDPASLEVLTCMKPVVYSKDKERVLLELDGPCFGWYSWASNRFERITVHGLPSHYPLCETGTFLDSLVSLGNGTVSCHLDLSGGYDQH